MSNSMEQTLRRVLAAFGPSGHEFQGISSCIQTLVEDVVDEIHTDALGNLICIKHGADRSRQALLMAHMDHVGLMVTEITEQGFLRVTPVGGLSPDKFLYRQVVFANGTHGVVSHESALELKTTDITMKHLYVDIGAASREDAQHRVSVADMCVYAPYALSLANRRIAAPAMDDRAGCAVVIEVLRRLTDCPWDVCAVFSVQEELGLRGASVAAFGQNPAFAVALDVCPTGDTPNAAPLGIKLGDGPALKVMDAHSISHVGLRRYMESKAKEQGVPFQLEILPYGGTDSAAIQRSRSGVVSATLSIPSRYVHSACEMVDLGDMDNAASLLTAILADPELADKAL